MHPVLAQIEIASPSRLIVLVLLPALVYLALRGRREQPLWQRFSSTSLRCLVFTMLCLAWAVPVCRRESDRKFVVVVVDQSESCKDTSPDELATLKSDVEAARGSNEVNWFNFPTTSRDSSVGAATDIAAANNFARAICPPDHVPQIVLLSDGLETAGDAVASATSGKIPISVLPKKSFARPELAIDAIVTPDVSPPHEPVELAVRLLANTTDSVKLRLTRNGEPIAEQQVDITPGETIWRKQAVLGDGELTTFRADISGGHDTFAENNTLSVVVAKGPRQRILLVAVDELVRPMQQAIQSGGFDVDVRSPNDFSTSLVNTKDYPLVILNDIAANQLSPPQLTTLDEYVQQGGGLIVIGGESTFGAAAYELTALEKMLPVVATEQPVEQQKSLALVLVVDKSRSMLDENRLGLAKEAAKKVADVLQDRDQVGVLAFGDQSQWISRLAPLSNKEEVLARIDKLQAAGLTNMYPAIERAYLSLSQADADSRHVILLTDGVPTPGDFDAVARRMAAAGITVSTVSLGKGADQTILEDISRIAGGNHYHVDNPSDLPKILERETRTAASKVTANEYAANTFRQLPGLNIVSAPPLKSYVATNYKPGAQLLLTAGEGDPLLTWWRHGRGKAMVLTSDMNQSAASWQTWPGNAAFWKRLVTYAMRDSAPDNVNIVFQQHGGKIKVALDAITREGAAPSYINDGVATVKVQSTLFDMPQVAPGRYEVEFDAAPLGDEFELNITLQSDGKTITEQRRGIVINYPEEFRLRPADEAKLKTIAAVSGGKYAPTPEEIFAPDGRIVDVLVPLWQYFLIAALLLYLADVAVRRVSRSAKSTTGAILKQAA